MNLRQFKKASKIKMKSMKIDDGDILILSADINKVHPQLAEQFFGIVKRQIKKEVIPIVIPTDMFLEKASREALVEYIEKVKRYIEKLGE